jgi:predicted PhzF superfamily epimerase YddE/YHI9
MISVMSRCFYPKLGVNEDPVTGSAHSNLIPYWAEKLGKKEMTAVQLSERSGTLYCEQLGERVNMSGKGVLYLQGEIYID